MIVPAVTEVSFPQAAHSQLARRRFSSQPLSWPQAGQDEAVGPAPGGEMPGTGGFIGKARLEGGAGHGAVIFPAAGHHGTLHEHPADAHQKLNISSNRAQRDTCLSMKLSKAAETQRMSHRGFQSLCHIRVRTVQLPPTSL